MTVSATYILALLSLPT